MGQIVDPVYVALVNQRAYAALQTSRRNSGNTDYEWATGVWTDQSYSNPTWMASLAGSKITGDISGNAGNVSGTIAIANGGTGQITANAALNALLPSQTGHSGEFLTTNGTSTSWAAAASGISIGSAISGGTATRVLFEGAGPVLADDDELTYDVSTNTLTTGNAVVGVGYPTVRNLSVLYGGFTLQHGPADGMFMQNIFNGGTTRLLVGPGDILSITGTGGIAIYGFKSQQTGAAADISTSIWKYDAGLRSKWTGYVSDDDNQDSLSAKPSGALATYWRPFAAYILSTDASPSWWIDSVGAERFGRVTSTGAIPSSASITSTWVDSTHATRKGRLSLNSYDFNGVVEGLRIDATGTSLPSVLIAGSVTVDQLRNVDLATNGAISTSATDGFTYLPSCAGNPSGTPTAKTGRVPIVLDTTNGFLDFYNSGWHRVAFDHRSFGVGSGVTPTLDAITNAVYLDRAWICDGAAAACDFDGSPSGSPATVTIQSSTDGTTWGTLVAVSISAGSYAGTASVTTSLAAGTWLRGKFTAINSVKGINASINLKG